MTAVEWQNESETNQRGIRPLWSFDWLAEKTRGEDPRVRLWALNRLGQCYPEKAASVAAKRLSDDDTFVRQNAAGLLGSSGHTEYRDRLYERYESEPAGMKGALLKALANLGDPRVVELGEPLLTGGDRPNMNLLLTYLESLSLLGTEEARKKQRDVFRKTHTEAVFSAVLPEILKDLSPPDHEGVVRETLEKIADGAMLKMRNVRKTFQDHLFMNVPSQPVETFQKDPPSPNDLVSNSDSPGERLPDQWPETVQKALSSFQDQDFRAAFDLLGTWSQRQDVSDKNDLQKKAVYVLRSFQNPPENILETDIPGRPIQQILVLGFLCVGRYLDEFSPGDLLDQARESGIFPEELYRYESGARMEEICSVLADSDPDRKQLLSDARRSDPDYRTVRAIRVLGELGDERVLEPALNAIDRNWPPLYRAGARALVQLKNTGVAAIDNHLSEQAFSRGHATAADVLRRIPTRKSADVFLSHFHELVRSVGLDPIVPFAVDLAVPETANYLRDILEDNVLLAGEQLLIVSDLFDLELEDRERIENRMQREANQFQGGPFSGQGSPMPGMDDGGGPMPGSGSNAGKPPPGN